MLEGFLVPDVGTAVYKIFPLKKWLPVHHNYPQPFNNQTKLTHWDNVWIPADALFYAQDKLLQPHDEGQLNQLLLIMYFMQKMLFKL